ncbi:MAG: response regulator transcription factor [Chloroflexales bacterium]|nr:response regulator transcription factor [Chloroflexales bacterium]
MTSTARLPVESVATSTEQQRASVEDESAREQPSIDVATNSYEAIEQVESRRVLVVDDEEPIVDLLREVLDEEGYTVDSSSTGAAGLNMALEEVYDAIVLDWMLPDLEGPDFVRRLVSAGVATPVLILTARQHLQDRVQGLDSGADDYLTKPFAVEELLARLRALIRRNARQAENRHLSYGDLVLDVQRRAARRGDQVLQLSAREFMLLQHLLKYAEQVLSREQIAEAVWGQQLEQLSNVVDLYIHYLRRKIERPGEPPLIRTVCGVGYTLRSGDLGRSAAE